MYLNIIGAGNLEQYILKSATLSTTLTCPPFTEIKAMATPIMRVAVEPKHPSDLSEVIKGLKLLNQADACVQVILTFGWTYGWCLYCTIEIKSTN